MGLLGDGVFGCGHHPPEHGVFGVVGGIETPRHEIGYQLVYVIGRGAPPVHGEGELGRRAIPAHLQAAASGVGDLGQPGGPGAPEAREVPAVDGDPPAGPGFTKKGIRHTKSLGLGWWRWWSRPSWKATCNRAGWAAPATPSPPNPLGPSPIGWGHRLETPSWRWCPRRSIPPSR